MICWNVPFTGCKELFESSDCNIFKSDKREIKNYFTCHLRKFLFGGNKIYKVYDHIVPTAAVPLKPNDTQHK